jgi:predicted phage gp36 major capsid-like protein
LIKAAAIQKEWERIRAEKERQRQELERRRIEQERLRRIDAARWRHISELAMASSQYRPRLSR